MKKSLVISLIVAVAVSLGCVAYYFIESNSDTNSSSSAQQNSKIEITTDIKNAFKTDSQKSVKSARFNNLRVNTEDVTVKATTKKDETAQTEIVYHMGDDIPADLRAQQELDEDPIKKPRSEQVFEHTDEGDCTDEDFLPEEPNVTEMQVTTDAITTEVMKTAPKCPCNCHGDPEVPKLITSTTENLPTAKITESVTETTSTDKTKAPEPVDPCELPLSAVPLIQSVQGTTIMNGVLYFNQGEYSRFMINHHGYSGQKMSIYEPFSTNQTWFYKLTPDSLGYLFSGVALVENPAELYLRFGNCTPIQIQIKVNPFENVPEHAPELSVNFDTVCLNSEQSSTNSTIIEATTNSKFPEIVNFIESIIELQHGNTSFETSTIINPKHFLITDNRINENSIGFTWTNLTSKCCSSDHFCCDKILPDMMNATMFSNVPGVGFQDNLYWNDETTSNFRSILKRNRVSPKCVENVAINKFLDKYKFCAMVKQDVGFLRFDQPVKDDKNEEIDPTANNILSTGVVPAPETITPVHNSVVTTMATFISPDTVMNTTTTNGTITQNTTMTETDSMNLKNVTLEFNTATNATLVVDTTSADKTKISSDAVTSADKSTFIDAQSTYVNKKFGATTVLVPLITSNATEPLNTTAARNTLTVKTEADDFDYASRLDDRTDFENEQSSGNTSG